MLRTTPGGGRGLCGGPAPVIGTQFASHGGSVRSADVPAAVPCGPALRAGAVLRGVARRRPALRLTVTAAGTTLREVRVALPRQLRTRRGRGPGADGGRLRCPGGG